MKPQQAPPALPAPTVAVVSELRAIRALLERERPLPEASIKLLAQQIGEQVEKRWLATRGMNVRAPATCQQPVRSEDVDVFQSSVPIAAATAIGTQFVLASYRCGAILGVVKGFGATAAPVPPATTDPYVALRYSLYVDNAPLAPYVNMAFSPSIGLAGLSACQVQLREGQVLELRVEKYAAAATDFLAGGRLKGWACSPTQQVDGVLGTIAY